MSFSGVYSVLATPFTSSGDVDHEGLKRVVDLAVKAGVDGVTALGVTGEVARLDDKERGQIVDTVVEHMNGRAKVIVGASADGVRTCVEYTRQAKAIGGDAVMVSPPRARKRNPESVGNHDTARAVAVELPIVVEAYTQLAGVKVVSLYRAGQIDQAATLFYRFVPLMRFEFQEGIGMAIRKEVLRRRGVIAHAATRAPGPVLDDVTRAALDRVLNWTAKQEGAAWILG